VICALLAAMVMSRAASAYYIDTGISEGCHEEMTLRVLSDFLAGTDAFADVELPADHRWQQYADAVFAGLSLNFDTVEEEYVAVSILIGTRWPDEHGRSVTSLSALYATHGDPSDQHEHCLRAVEEDGSSGDATALSRARAFLDDEVATAMSYQLLPSSQRNRAFTEYVEYYGPVSIVLYAPGYYLGMAIHGLQDCFSHTLRAEDLFSIVHVLNFVDAVSDDYSEARDGLAHSYAMDACNARTEPLREAAAEATFELLGALLSPSTQDARDVVSAVADRWMALTPGCTMDNDYCDSPWLELAQEAPAEPIMGCAAVPPRRSASLFSLLLAFSGGSAD